MKAVVVRGPGEVALETVPDPTPVPGQLVLRVKACGICGSDVHMHRVGVMPPGTIMGHEFCGEVVESRAGFEVGERLCAVPVISCGRCERCRSGLGYFCGGRRVLGTGDAPGAFAEFVAVAPHETVRLPDRIDDAGGALVEPLAVALHAVNVGRLRRGESCLVLGGGPVGLAIAMWARHFGADPVLLSERVAARRAIAPELGASAVVDPAREDLAARLRELAPAGPAVVFEATGAAGVLQEAIASVRFRGRVVVVGLCLAPDKLQTTEAMLKEVNLHFVLGYEKDDFQYAVDMLSQGHVAPERMITDRIGLDDVPAAFDDLRRPRAQCKVLVFPTR